MANFTTKFLLLDGEYGGVKSRGVSNQDFSILELAITVTDINLDVYETLVLKIKPDDDKYIVSAEGLAANKINLVHHDKVAITHGKAKELLHNFLKKHSDGGRVKLFPLGKGIGKDIQFIFNQKLISEHYWREFISDQIIDFGGIIMLLKLLGVYPQTVKKSTGKMSNSLEALAEDLNISTDSLHEAKGDVDLYIKVCKHLFSLFKKHLPQAKLPTK